ncbi:MAG: TlpA family protein disulfide reductase [Candidatus Bathyarchaeia archaeon]
MSGYKRKSSRRPKCTEMSSIKKRIKAERRRETFLALLLFLGVTVAAIVGGWYLLQPAGQGGPSPETGQEPSGISEKHPGTLAPDFSLTDLDGATFRLSDFRGKVVVIDFMATWCGPCRAEMPHYGTIWEKYGDKIVLMSIDVDPRESAEVLRAFADEFPYATWIWARDTANLGQVYQVTAIPKTVIIDQDGYIRFTHVGVTDASTFIQEIDQLLGQG